MLYIVYTYNWVGDECDGYDEEVIVISTLDKNLAQKVLEHGDYLMRIYYTEEHTVQMNKIEFLDMKCEVDKLKEQIKIRDKEIDNREKIIKQLHTKIMNLNKED